MTQASSIPGAGLTPGLDPSVFSGSGPRAPSGLLPTISAPADEQSAWTLLHSYSWVFLVAFVVTLVATPVMRRLALANGVIDRPSEARKQHRLPVAYLGGAAVFLGLVAGVLLSYVALGVAGLCDFHVTRHLPDGANPMPVPLSVLLGMTVIALVGLIDDVTGISPRVKIGGQLLAAAALAIDDVGVKVAQGVLTPIGALIGNSSLTWMIPAPFLAPLTGVGHVELDLIYWAGTAIIAMFVLGACNASNLIDGLDGLLTGVTGIAAMGLLVLALGLALVDDGPRDAQRIVLCMALLGACLGFLPHNFNPATIFLGDCGSLLLGYVTIVIILTLGDTGKTHLVFAGLLIYAIPLIDTFLAIVRRKMAGKRISDADDQHLHHMLKRSMGGVKGAVFSLYGIGVAFAALGVAVSLFRARAIYMMAFVFIAYITVIAIKIARQKQLEAQALALAASGPPGPSAGSGPARPAGEPSPPARVGPAPVLAAQMSSQPSPELARAELGPR